MRPFGRGARIAVPPALSVEVERPGLTEALDRATEGPLTIVSAGPGWGKTTAVAGWARNRQVRGLARVAWLSLDPADDSPVEFWGLFLDAIARSGVVPPGHPLTVISVSGGVSDEVQLSLFRALAVVPREVVNAGCGDVASDAGVGSVVIVGVDPVGVGGCSCCL